MILYNFKPMQKFIVTDVLSSLKYAIGTYGLICNVDPNDSDISIEWADGSAGFTKIWANRLEYTYS